jgi:hypothetical protein
LVASSPEEFRRAIREHRFGRLRFDRDVSRRARSVIEDAGVLLVGEPHGVYETPGVLYSLVAELDIRAIAFEWSHEEMDEAVQSFRRDGRLDLEKLWSLPESADFFCGDGRITAGLFALLQRLRDERRLDQVIAFDRLDPELPPRDAFTRDREMAERLLEQWDGSTPLLAVAGAFHTQLDTDEGETLAAHLARHLPGLEPASIDYAVGECWSRGRARMVSTPTPPAPIMLRAPRATPAVVPRPRLHGAKKS